MKIVNGKYVIRFLDGSEKTFNTLIGANLREADLEEANLWGADLGGVDLRGANLREANLWGADLEGADLGGADLSGADLGGANLEEADLREADLRGANLSRADLREADLRGANLRGAYLYKTCITAFQSGQHFAFAFIYKNVKYIKIGCLTKTVEKWLTSYKEVGLSENYSKEEIKKYGNFIKLNINKPIWLIKLKNLLT